MSAQTLSKRLADTANALDLDIADLNFFLEVGAVLDEKAAEIERLRFKLNDCWAMADTGLHSKNAKDDAFLYIRQMANFDTSVNATNPGPEPE